MNQDPSQKQVQMKQIAKKSFSGKKVAVGILAVVAVVAIVIAAYSSYQLHLLKSPAQQQKLLDEQTAQIVARVGKLIELPAETPQIATVSDANTLKQSQPFFDNAINGDEVLVFSDEAILYRPSINKIITVAPVTSANPAAAQVPAQSATPIAPAAQVPAKK